MLRATLKNLLAHKVRMGLSALAVVLGVAFVAGTLVFTDTLGKTFRDLFGAVVADVTVVHDERTPSDEAGIPEDLRARIAAVEGVDVAEGNVALEGVRLFDQDRKQIGSTGGAPGLGVNWSDTPGISPLTLQQGRPPQGEAEIAIDSVSAETGGLALGDRVDVSLPQGRLLPASVVGIFRFGETGNLAGATLTAFEPATAQQLLLEPGRWTDVSVRAQEGVADEVVRDRIAPLLPQGYTARTAAEQTEATASELEEALSFINTFLLVFAFVALFVGSFLILNTFTMLVAQRTRELALLRAVGASRRQITRSILVEALAVGLVASVVGLGAGVLVAYGLKALFGAIGLELGNTPLVIGGWTVLWSFVVGVGVTVLAAYVPARRASRVPPVAAMRDDVAMAPKGLRVRGAIGAALTLLGAGVLVAGLLADGSASLLGVGAGVLAILVGVAVLSPVLSRPVVGVLAAAFPRLLGAPGRLGRDNAQRNPRRTAATASALMIGLALIGAIGTLAASTSTSVGRIIDRSVGADYVVASTDGFSPFAASVAQDVRTVDGVATASAVRYGEAVVAGEEAFVAAVDPATVDAVLRLDYVEGSAADLSGDSIVVSEQVARDKGWQVGSTVPVELPGGERQLRVAGLWEPSQVLGGGPYLVSLDTLGAREGGRQGDNFVYVAARDGADPAAVEQALETRLASYPTVGVRNSAEYKQDQQDQLSVLTNFIYGLLTLSVLIAVLGIVNTLALSVIERTREIGLLRAVGMSRRQVRRMVRLESVVISLFGAVLGLAVGIGIAAALQRALADDGIEVLTVPLGQLVAFLVVAAVIGVLAAIWPARRAARLDVLRAIATQ